MLELTRPLVFFDLETTGTDTREDRIVQLAMVKLTPRDEGAHEIEEKVYLFNPGVPIPPEASAIHGITDEMVADEPGFAARARAMCSWLDGCDFAGYNVRRFDLPMLYEECKRAECELPVRGAAIVDAATLYFRANPRSLAHAVSQYLDLDLAVVEADAHDALWDTRATRDLLFRMIEEEELPWDPARLHALCDEEWGPVRIREVERWFDWTDEGQPVFALGKHKGQLVRDAPDSYIDWMRRKITDDEVLQVLNLVQTAAVSDIRKNVLDPPQQDLGL